MGLQPFYGKGPQPSLWAGSRAACGEIAISVVSNSLKYCDIFIVYTQLTNVAAGRGFEIHALKEDAACLNDVQGLERKP
jgi:hypothetical protein